MVKPALEQMQGVITHLSNITPLIYREMLIQCEQWVLFYCFPHGGSVSLSPCIKFSPSFAGMAVSGGQGSVLERCLCRNRCLLPWIRGDRCVLVWFSVPEYLRRRGMLGRVPQGWGWSHLPLVCVCVVLTWAHLNDKPWKCGHCVFRLSLLVYGCTGASSVIT